MCKLINIIVLSFGLIGVSVGQIEQSGQCDSNIQLQANFNIEQFLGSWHEYARADHPQGGDCSTIELAAVGETITVYHKTVRENFLEEHHGTASLEEGTAKLTLNLPQISSNPIDFWVMLTDYNNFALMYGCENVGNTHRRLFVWQLSKQPTYPNDLMPALMETIMINILGIDSSYLRQISHSDEACYVLPQILPNQPVILPGQCDVDIPVVQNFNAAKFLGVWHQISRYYSENALGSCNRAQYTSQDGIVVDVVNSQIIGQALLKIEGQATVVAGQTNGKLKVVLQISPTETVESELLIIATDYDHWAISYTCENHDNDQKRVFSWILSRTRQLHAAAQIEVNAVVNSIVDLNYAYYQTTDQSNDACFYYPDPVPNEPAVFGGQCDQKISVQQNFDVEAYLGMWHDIESYHNPFQFGTCANAQYSLGTNGVDVRNTQVVNEELNVIHGNAYAVGENGEAKLVVTFPVEGSDIPASTDYWVISTDYKSYALVYSCRNVNEYQQQIIFWKLSRSRILTSDANTAINTAMESIPVLQQRYFKPMDQTTAGCFYYPKPVPGQQVVFPGQCEDDNMNVVSNFNLNSFSGQWFEVEAYPKDPQPGQCIDHQFSVASNTVLNLVSTSIADQLLGISASQLTSINGNDGRFTVVVGGNPDISFPYYIITTDYTDYALAYSCVNVDDYFKRIFSWKLSRSKQLTNDAVTAINSAIADITVLSNDYFEPIDQTDFACFYFPDLAPGAPVILPGQCENDDIPVVKNFDVAAYLGRWRLIESYPSDNQGGTCNQATYSELPSGAVSVHNTQVIGQALFEINGEATVSVSADNEIPGKLSVTFPGSAEPFELWVLDTDYKSHSLVYGCVNQINNQRRVWSWKLSREPYLTEDSVKAINEVISKVTVLNDRYYQVIDHSDAACFYYPEPDSSSPVIFRGQCDTNIPVVTNFDAEGYTGLWHDIARYPAPFQYGTCGNANYELLSTDDGPVVDVLNTQVIDESLDTIKGYAVLDHVDASDTSAKLLVTFPVGGVDLTTPYWVLATDYRSYALVYSCSNIDKEHRSVTTWKLSRQKYLSDDANTAIKDVIDKIDVLDDRYFIPQDQTPKGCFYFPEPQPDKPVVFPGQCNLNVPVVENFNMNLFQGIWHEIEAYPKEQQGGQCINHQFTVNTGNTLNFNSYNVIAQSLGITSGTASFSFNDNTGRLNLVFTSNGVEITIPFWIIDTDYENYALAYSCVNQADNTDYRGVWSWKLSKSKELSATYRDAIDKAIEKIDVLDNKYYVPIDQSDEACFYLPDTNPGDPVIFPGQCDTNIKGVADFDAAKYLGLWRLIETYPTEFQLGTCGEATYSLGDNGNVVVYNTEVVSQTLSTIYGSAEVASNDGTGKLLVTFPGAPTPSEYYILATDYNDYALVYSCYNINDEQRRVYSWKLSRKNSLSEDAVNDINQVVSSIDVLNSRYYEPVDRSYSGCFYFPEPDSSKPVIFRGQCDEKIPVVTNFDAVGYMGLWHDIQRYPAPFQDGTCGNARYELVNTNTGPVVDVLNTQVKSQTLDTINGIAVLDHVDETDTSAKLLVTFPVGGNSVTTPYWVLATDYLSYALVYSCSNIDEYYKSVSSWKISRSRFLSASANTYIDNVVKTIDVLDERYYETQDQSAEGCFYFPEPEDGKPVVFPGQCDLDIDVVQNFDFAQFEGVWHEIEAYPKEEQTGQCISHEFSTSPNNVLNFQSFNVIAESLGITSGTVTITSNDNSAKMNLVFSSGGTTITIPYWIIDTDYKNYALAYSCVNQPNELYRGVWSWKLSRTKHLSTTSVSAINNAIQKVDVLDNKFYEPISQTDDSCFYYPVLGSGEPVIFPGQCDTKIPVVQNFDATKYLGLWRLIESYPTEFQLGACNDAEYSLGDDGNVIVYNTQVVSQTLSTIEGSARVASVDGSGKLLVTFPNAPEESEYWILDTDYDRYSLVYSCVNINKNQRRVYSWKLSRSDILTPEATTAIEQTMDKINVLDKRYYDIIDRSAEACFYFPEPNGNPVVFRGQCDQTIPVVTNFDAVRYMHTWYNIESYPAPFQGGTCGTANYELDLDTLVVSVENTQVLNQVLDVQTGTAVLATSDNSAKLLVTFDVNGSIVTTDYWVLTTDYDNYALVYSCRNLNKEYRQVNSFKLSRERKLNSDAKTAIDSVISKIQVLDQMYFEDGGQSEEDCFYYPDNNDGDVLLNGECLPDSEVPAMPSFDANAFVGTWHEVARFPSDLQEGECSAAEYSVGAQNNVVITQTEVKDEFQTAFDIPGTLSSDGRGIITADIPGIPINTFYILDTDYKEYALVYGCRNTENNKKQIYSWKLSKSRSGLTSSANDKIDQLVSSNIDLFESYYSYTDQSNDACFHYPEYEELPPSIKLPGPCDESIRGVPNFNVNSYLGRWIDIERYPQTDQFGTCDRAYYSLGENNVFVRNTQVVDETLTEQLGYAELASNDGSGQLRVTFDVNGNTVVANYYILDTDYLNYAFVYSCRNLDSGERQVSSWKLSRTTDLSAQANAAINAVIAQTQGLWLKYYESTEQSEDACFYVPELDTNAAPVFRGQCDDNVDSMKEFDPASFVGWWHEIERYPVDNYRGECISSQYTQGTGNTYQVVDTAVEDGAGQVDAYTVQLLEDARLRRIVNGQPKDIWILDTDYSTYALLYSCENVDLEHKRIWSAKHSKARVLTPEAQAIMAPIIESNKLLYPKFYLNVDQSDEACFHYPTPGQQIILPGQCDDSIPVEQSFDVEAYGGTWYQIQRYPQIHENQASTCIGARYTLDQETAVVTVLNWEVIDGVLETIEGTATISSSDGSAKLSVVLPVVGSPTNATVTTSLYVLKTNYESYSLVYSCSNINDYQRSIGAWKLSRERALSSADEAEITNYMNNREELHQPYFLTVSHDEECEEPSSGTFLKSSIIVMIICALWQILS